MIDRLKWPFDLAGKRVWVTGHRGLVGGALVRRLESENCEILTASRDELDLRRQAETEAWIAARRPEVVIVAAGTVGGIHANDTRPAEFIYDNLAIATNAIHGAWRAGAEKLLMLGSACIYPRMAPQPMAEEALLTGPLEPTNQWYAIAKISALMMCEAYRRQYAFDAISAQPINIYGPGDNFDLDSSHVVPALMAKAHRAKIEGAKTLTVWGSGRPRREFMYVDDVADALVFLLKHYSGPVPLNIGTGEELTIRELAETVAAAVGFKGELIFDSTKPDGTPRKLLDVGKIKALGWAPKTSLRDGLAEAYAWYVKNVAK